MGMFDPNVAKAPAGLKPFLTDPGLLPTPGSVLGTKRSPREQAHSSKVWSTQEHIWATKGTVSPVQESLDDLGKGITM